MKKSVLSGGFAFALLLFPLSSFSGCYSTVEVGDGPTGEAESGVIVKQTKKDLPRCNRGHDGIVYYVSDSGKFFYCDGDKRKYIRLHLVGQDGSSCTVTQYNGSATISCEDGTDATVSDGQDGADGAPGADGQDGTSCTVIDNLDGTKTISCTDGTSVTVSDGAQGPPGADGAPGADGQDGTSCTVVDNLDGTKTISCPDGTSVTVSDGQDGADGTSCTVVDNLDGTYDITCGDNTVTVTDDSCTVLTNGCIATVSCDDGTFATVPLADTACDFGDSPGICAAGICEENLCANIDCEDGDPCTIDSCDPLDGSCSYVNTCGDTDPPELVDFDFNPKSVDVTTGPANVLCEATLTDPSGVDYLICSFRSPSGGQFHNCRANSPTSGDINDGVWSCTVTIPQAAEPGLWDINQLQSRDLVGNIGNYSPSTLLEVISQVADTDPPELVEFDFNPKQVDVTTGPANVLCEATLTDPSGVDYLICSFRSPSGGQFHNCRANSPTSGDINDGVWSCTVTIPQAAEPGLWDINQLQSRDLVGNIGNYSPSTLLEVISQVADTDPPELVDFDFNPKQVDVTTGPANVLCEATLTDPSGVDYLICSFRSPSGGQFQNCRAENPTSGDIYNGVWSCTVTIPQNAEPGLWDINQLQSRDLVGNIGNYSSPILLDVTAFSGPDLDPPVLVDFDFNPESVDVSTQSQTVRCELNVTDTGSGASRGQSPNFSRCVLNTPSSSIPSKQCNLSLVSGDVFDGVWACNISIAQGSLSGLWTWDDIRMFDAAGNSFLHRTADLETAGFPTQLDVVSSTADLDPPVLVDFDFTPRQIDVSTQSQTVRCELNVTDTGSGASRGQSPNFSRCVLNTPSSSIPSKQCNLSLVSGDVFDGVWACNISIAQGSLSGLWTWDDIRMFDAAGNSFLHRTADLETAGFPTQLDVVSSTADLDPPVLVDFDFTPRQIDVSTQSQTVRCELNVTDTGSGASRGQSPNFSRCVLNTPSSSIPSKQCNLSLVSGDVFDGVWACNISIAQGSLSGLWTWDDIRMFDAAGNSFLHRTADLETAGFPTQLDVTYGSGSPP